VDPAFPLEAEVEGEVEYFARGSRFNGGKHTSLQIPDESARSGFGLNAENAGKGGSHVEICIGHGERESELASRLPASAFRKALRREEETGIAGGGCVVFRGGPSDEPLEGAEGDVFDE
jgi:hypothetical protein